MLQKHWSAKLQTISNWIICIFVQVTLINNNIIE